MAIRKAIEVLRAAVEQVADEQLGATEGLRSGHLQP
jgi:hypothetical protein